MQLKLITLFIILLLEILAGCKQTYKLTLNTYLENNSPFIIHSQNLYAISYNSLQVWDLTKERLLKSLPLNGKNCSITGAKHGFVTKCESEFFATFWKIKDQGFKKYILSSLPKSADMNQCPIDPCTNNFQCLNTYLTEMSKWKSFGYYAAEKQLVNKLKLWDSQGKLKRVIQDYPGYIVSAALDDKFIMGALNTGEIRVWDKATGELKKTLEARNKIETLLTSQGKVIAQLTDKRIQVWDFKDEHTYILKYVKTDNERNISSTSISVQGNILAADDGEQRVHLWDLHSGKHLSSTKIPDYPSFIQLAQNKIYYYTNQKIAIWNLAKQKIEDQFDVLYRGNVNHNLDHLFVREQKLIASFGSFILVWDLNSKKLIKEIYKERYDPQNQQWYQASRWNLLNSPTKWSEKAYSYSSPRTIYGQEDFLTRGEDWQFNIWNLTTQKIQAKIEVPTHNITTFDLNNRFLLTGTDDPQYQMLYLWDLQTGKLVKSFNGHSSPIEHVLLHNNQIFSFAKDQTLKIWDINLGTLEKTFKLPSDLRISKIIPSQNQLFILANQKINILDLSTENIVLRFPQDPNKPVTGIEDSDDNNIENFEFFQDRILASSSRGKLTYYDRVTGQPLKELNIADVEADNIPTWIQPHYLYVSIQAPYLVLNNNESYQLLNLKTQKQLNFNSDIRVYLPNSPLLVHKNRTIAQTNKTHLKIWNNQTNQLEFTLNDGNPSHYIVDFSHAIVERDYLIVPMKDIPNTNIEYQIDCELNLQAVECPRSSIPIFLNIWDLKSGKITGVIKSKSKIKKFALNNKRIITLNDKQVLEKWDLKTGHLLTQYKLETPLDEQDLNEMELGETILKPDYHIIQPIHYKGIFNSFAPQTGKLLKTIECPHQTSFLGAEDPYQFDENYLYCIQAHQVIAYSFKNLSVKAVIPIPEIKTRSPITKFKTYQEIKTIKIEEPYLYAIVDSYSETQCTEVPDGPNPLLAQRTLLLWNLKENKLEAEYTLPTEPDYEEIHINPEHSTITLDHETRELKTGQLISNYRIFKSSTSAMIITNNGYYAGMGDFEKYINLTSKDQVYPLKDFESKLHNPEEVLRAIQHLPPKQDTNIEVEF